MSLHDLSIIILISLLIVLLPAVGLAKLFVKAGIPSWKAWVPFLNTWEMLKVARYKQYWFWIQFIPVLGWFISIWILVEFVELFGKYGFLNMQQQYCFHLFISRISVTAPIQNI